MAMTSTAVEALPHVPASGAERRPGPESKGDFWKVYPHTDGGHELAVWVAKGVRRKMRLPKKYGTADERARFAKGAAAEMKRQHRQEEKDGTPKTAGKPDPSRLTFGEVADLWTSGDLAKRYPDHVHTKASVDLDATRLLVLKEKLGDLPLASFRVEDAERAMRALPDRCKTPATRRQYAQLIRRVVALAVYPLRAIEHNPLPRGFLPGVGAPKAKVFLYPSEDAKLMACTRVPLVFRLFYGMLAREGMREGEANTLTWNRLDLDRGVLTLDENKTDDARAWALDPGVVRALVAWKKLTPKPEAPSRVFVEDNGGVLDGVPFAHVFREKHLRMAEVERAELYERSKNRAPIRVHDLRATFVTLSLANGKTESWVQDRTGHTSSMMINRYRRTARQAGELGLGTLAPLDQAIPELKERTPPPTTGGPSDGVSPPVSGVGDVRDGSPPLPSSKSSRALAEHKSTEPHENRLLVPHIGVRIPTPEPRSQGKTPDSRPRPPVLPSQPAVPSCLLRGRVHQGRGARAELANRVTPDSGSRCGASQRLAASYPTQ